MSRLLLCSAVFLVVTWLPAVYISGTPPDVPSATPWETLPKGASYRLGSTRLRTDVASNVVLAFSPTKPVLASGGADGLVRLWSVPKGDLLGEVATFQMPRLPAVRTVTALAFSPDGNLLAVADSALVIVYRLPNFEVAWKVGDPILPYASKELVFSPDGRWLAFEHDRGHEVAEATTGNTKLLWCGVDRPIAFSPDGKKLLVAGPKELSLLGIPDGREEDRWKVPGRFVDGSFSSDGNRCLFRCEDGSVLVRDLPQKLTVETLPPPLSARAAFFSHDGRAFARVAIGTATRWLAVAPPEDQKETSWEFFAFRPHPFMRPANVSHDGKWSAASATGVIRLIDNATGTLLPLEPEAWPIRDLPTHPRAMYITNGRAVWELATGKLIGTTERNDRDAIYWAPTNRGRSGSYIFIDGGDRPFEITWDGPRAMLRDLRQSTKQEIVCEYDIDEVWPSENGTICFASDVHFKTDLNRFYLQWYRIGDKAISKAVRCSYAFNHGGGPSQFVMAPKGTWIVALGERELSRIAFHSQFNEGPSFAVSDGIFRPFSHLNFVASSDDSYCAAVLEGKGPVLLWDVLNRKETLRIPIEERAPRLRLLLRFSSDNKCLIVAEVGTETTRVTAYDLAKAAIWKAHTVDGDVLDADIVQGSLLIVSQRGIVTCSDQGTESSWTVAANDDARHIACAHLDAQGRVFLGQRNGGVFVWDVATKQVLATERCEPCSIHSIRYMAPQETIVCILGNGTVLGFLFSSKAVPNR